MRRLATKTATALLVTPPLPARDGAVLARGAVLGVYARTRNERRKKGKRIESAKRNGENKEPLERSAK